jgi:hypothetical protein
VLSSVVPSGAQHRGLDLALEHAHVALARGPRLQRELGAQVEHLGARRGQHEADRLIVHARAGLPAAQEPAPRRLEVQHRRRGEHDLGAAEEVQARLAREQLDAPAAQDAAGLDRQRPGFHFAPSTRETMATRSPGSRARRPRPPDDQHHRGRGREHGDDRARAPPAPRRAPLDLLLGGHLADEDRVHAGLHEALAPRGSSASWRFSCDCSSGVSAPSR